MANTTENEKIEGGGLSSIITSAERWYMRSKGSEILNLSLKDAKLPLH